MTRASRKNTEPEQTAPPKDAEGDAPESTTFAYVGEDARTYEDRSLEVVPGDVHEWPEGAPDYRWEPATDEQIQAYAAKLAEQADETPSSDSDEDDSTPDDSGSATDPGESVEGEQIADEDGAAGTGDAENSVTSEVTPGSEPLPPLEQEGGTPLDPPVDPTTEG